MLLRSAERRELAGGVRTERDAVLAAPAAPAVGRGAPLVSAAICHAELVATAAGIGIRSAPAYALC